MAVRSIIQGLDYQARWFWLEAARLFRHEPVVRRVALEAIGYAKSFDDVVTVPIRSDRNAWGQQVDIDLYQAKFKVVHTKRITPADLIDPTFIGATRWSLLDKLARGQRVMAAAGLAGRYSIVTPWKIDDDLQAFTTTNGELDLDALFQGGDGSAPGRIRKPWRDHLGLATDGDLRRVLEPFRLFESSPLQVDRTLEAMLDSVGLSLVPTGGLSHPYVDLAHGFVKGRQREFDEPTLRAILNDAGLWRPATDPLPGHPLAIRSRRPFAAHLEDEARDLLDLVPLFHARSIATGVDWNSDIAPGIAAFLESRITAGETYRLYLDAHNAIAFAAGWNLAHSGAEVVPMQRTGPALVPWPSAGAVPDEPLWESWEQVMPSGGHDIALALGVTHDVRADVEAYVDAHLPAVGRIIGLTVPNPTPTSVRDGAHAFGLAEAVVAHVTRERTLAERGGRLHVFAAAPNALVFFLGRLGRPLGPTTIYEFDFDRRTLGAYTPAITLPPAT